MHIKKGDNVMLTTGTDKGKSGKVLRVFVKTNLALVEGVNMKKHHQKSKTSGTKGAIVEKAHPVAVSNLAKK